MSKTLYLISISAIFTYLSSAESFTNPVVLKKYRHTSEILQVWFQTAALKRVTRFFFVSQCI
jgi:hypothetical protein